MKGIRALGAYYGYPACCIAAFEQLIRDKIKSPRKLKGTGYIPCAACNEKTEAALITAINTTRMCPKPFPISRLGEAE